QAARDSAGFCSTVEGHPNPAESLAACSATRPQPAQCALCTPKRTLHRQPPSRGLPPRRLLPRGASHPDSDPGVIERLTEWPLLETHDHSRKREQPTRDL